MAATGQRECDGAGDREALRDRFQVAMLGQTLLITCTDADADAETLLRADIRATPSHIRSDTRSGPLPLLHL